MDHGDARMLRNLEGKEHLLIAALESTCSGIILTDNQLPDNPIIYCNEAFEKMTGYSRKEILDKNCRFLQGEDREQIGRYKVKEALANGKDCNVEIANYRKDGTIFYNELHIAPIKNDSGIVTHYIGIQNDVTIRKQKEISLQLELKHANELQQQRDEFTSLASHELRTPITSLGATLQLMNRLLKDSPVEDGRLTTLAQNAERHIKKFSHLLDDLLITTVTMHSALPLNKTRFTVSELLDSCCYHFTSSGKYFIKMTGDQTLEIYADQQRIEQVMINLIDNAIKFAPKSNKVTIDISHMNDSIKIIVQDFGVGIQAHQMSHLFKRYDKAGNDQARQSGLGLSLYTSSEIVKQHGGEIDVDSEYGKGSRFWFTIPDHSAS